MTPKEKAIELVKEFYCKDISTKKMCIVIDLITAKELASKIADENIEKYNVSENWISLETTIENKEMEYWIEVKEEISYL